MERKNGERKTSHPKQTGTLITAGVIVQLIALLIRIPLTRVIGDEGNGIYAATFELYTMLLIITVGCTPEVIAKAIASRMTRGQFKNANQVFKVALLWNVAMGILVALILLFGAYYLAEKLLLVPFSIVSLRMLAPAAVLSALVMSLRGYFQGIGTHMPTSVSRVAEQAFAAVTSVIAALLLCDYGIKVARLLHNTSFAAAYAVMGISVGTIVGLTISFLFLLFVFYMYKQQRRRMLEKDTSRMGESSLGILHSFLYAWFPTALVACVYNVNHMLEQIIYNHMMQESNAEYIVNFGIYSGKYRVLIWIPIVIASMMWTPMVTALESAYERVDMRLIRNKVATVYRLVMVIVMPFAVSLTLLTRPVLNMLFKGDVLVSAKMLQVGTLAILLLAFSAVGNAVLQGMGKSKIIVINTLAALGLHVVLLIVMLKYLDLDIYAIVYANMLMAFVMCCLNQLALKKYMKYTPEWIRTVVMPFIAAMVTGVIELAIFKIFENPIGNTPALLLAFFIGLLVYTVFIVVFHIVNEKELLAMPFGKGISRIAKLLRVL